MDNALADRELIVRVRHSNPEAFGELFRKYQPIVLRQVYFQVRERDVAHELVQETFVRIWEHRSSLKPELPFLALALRISKNLISDMARHHAMRERLEPQMPSPPLSEGDDPVEALERHMLDRHIEEVLKTRLGEKCRTVFLLSRYEGMSHREIADFLGISVKTVEHQIGHARKILRRSLRERSDLSRGD